MSSPWRTADSCWGSGRRSRVTSNGDSTSSGIRPARDSREYVEVLREIWASWEEDRHPSYEGEFYSITLCPADWRPEPIEHSHVPIYIAGVNSYNVTLAGECCDGLHVHPLNSPEYIEREVVPDIETGAARADRDPDDVTLVTNVFAITGETDAEREQAREEIRRQIAFYGSTRTYKRIFAVHGWENVCDDLHELSVEDRWDEMPALVTDEMVETFSVEGRTTNSETRSKSGTPISIGSRCTRRTRRGTLAARPVVVRGRRPDLCLDGDRPRRPAVACVVSSVSGLRVASLGRTVFYSVGRTTKH